MLVNEKDKGSDGPIWGGWFARIFGLAALCVVGYIFYSPAAESAWRDVDSVGMFVAFALSVLVAAIVYAVRAIRTRLRKRVTGWERLPAEYQSRTRWYCPGCRTVCEPTERSSNERHFRGVCPKCGLIWDSRGAECAGNFYPSREERARLDLRCWMFQHPDLSRPELARILSNELKDLLIQVEPGEDELLKEMQREVRLQRGGDASGRQQQ